MSMAAWDQPPKSRDELNKRLREYRIEGRKNFVVYIELQTQRRLVQAEELSQRARARIEQSQCIMGSV